MTSEVALMNRRAVALAADSAATFSHWNRGQRRERYFKGANKIFHLSLEAPVGLMIYDNGTLQGLPWDTLVKRFRHDEGRSKFASLSEYGEHFFKWINENRDAFPDDFLIAQFISDVKFSVGKIFYACFSASEKIEDNEKKKDKIREEFEKWEGAVVHASFIVGANDLPFDEYFSNFKKQIVEEISKDRLLSVAVGIIDSDRLIKTAILAVFKKDFTTLSTTGVVVSGFGEKDYFPRLDSFTCYGFVPGKLLFEKHEDETKVISQFNTAEIVPFAQTDVIYTFIFGTGVSGLNAIEGCAQETLDGLKPVTLDVEKPDRHCYSIDQDCNTT